MNVTGAEPAKHIVVDQIAQRLHQIFDELVIVPPRKGASEADTEQHFLTRSFSALALLEHSDANVSDSASSITDGGEDDGIDAIYVSENHKKIYLIQSKWLNNTQKGVQLNEFTRFRDGTKRLISLAWDERNSGLHAYKDDVERMLKDIDTEIVMVLAHTSEQPLSQDIVRATDEFLGEQNKFGELISFKEFTLREAREVARSRTRPENINATIMLANWGLIERPYKAAYGAVAALDVVAWHNEHEDRLFAENLRYGIEKSEVNDGIRATAHEEPESFWYFNNGITAICEDISKQPVGGNSTDSGVFDVKKISIINGAQTASSLSRAHKEGADLTSVKIHMRIISLAGTNENFATAVTTANNTQNDLNPVDFVAADPNQDRLRREAAQIGLVYTYRRGEEEPAKDNGFTIRTATIAAACASCK